MKAVKKPTILLITPPLTQVNTPYPATAVLKGFLTQYHYSVFQMDLGIELVLDVLKPKTLSILLDQIRSNPSLHNTSITRPVALENEYLKTITPVVRFLQGKDPTLAHRIICDGFLPEGPRFQSIEDMDWAFGTLGIQDRARFLATQYIEEIVDLVRTGVSEAFGFSRYAERLALSAVHFQPIEDSLQEPDTLIDQLMLSRLNRCLNAVKPDLIGFSVPFPGCLFGALKCCQYIRSNYPDTQIVMGGGYINTELRDLEDPGLFSYVDFLVLDDGETPTLQIARYLNGEIDRSELVRTFCLENGNVTFVDNPDILGIPFASIGTPDYSDLHLDRYLSIIEIPNPMHRLWSDGRWNKLTLAHGCYWKKCAFCDVSLDYISRFETAPIKTLVDRIETIMDQTGQTGFHFVDEAAPPRIIKELAIELLNRNLIITWWTNIRFEKRFSKGLCELMAASGCIGVSGGLETASDRLLKKMNKGVTISQAAKVTNALQNAGIMVHAYLMYGFPTQTAQETIDALEIVRQFFLNGLIQSAFWHRFALTQHSPIGKEPQKYGIAITGPESGDFAKNDLQYDDPFGADHDLFSIGMQKSVYNFMHGVGLDFILEDWFDFKAPTTTCSAGLIRTYLESKETKDLENRQLLWIGCIPDSTKEQQLTFQSHTNSQTIEVLGLERSWLLNQITHLTPQNLRHTTVKDWQSSFETNVGGEFSVFLESELWELLTESGLLLL